MVGRIGQDRRATPINNFAYLSLSVYSELFTYIPVCVCSNHRRSKTFVSGDSSRYINLVVLVVVVVVSGEFDLILAHNSTDINFLTDFTVVPTHCHR